MPSTENSEAPHRCLITEPRVDARICVRMIEFNMSPVVDLLLELIALPSINPAFLEGRPQLTGEKRVSDFLQSWCGRARMDVETRLVLPDRQNLFATISPSMKPQGRVVLAPHLDTANIQNEASLTPRVGGERVYGRGACDTKGCIAAMLTAMARVARGGARPERTEIVFLGLVDEESGQEGSRAVAASGWKADLAIVGEPTRLKVVTAHKGDVWLYVDTRGKAAHGSRPELGKNAIEEMARVVAALVGPYASGLQAKRHGLLGKGTINVGTIQGGNQPNIVPDSCRISIDRRTLPGEDQKTVIRELRALLRARGIRASISNMRGGSCVALETDICLPLVHGFMRTVGQRRPCGVDYFCDAAVLSAGGIPSVVFGPGDIAQAHTAKEWIATNSLETGTDLLETFLRTLP